MPGGNGGDKFSSGTEYGLIIVVMLLHLAHSVLSALPCHLHRQLRE